MVQVSAVTLLSEIREQRESREFPSKWLTKIQTAIESASTEAFTEASSGYEIQKFDEEIAGALADFAFEHGSENGRNPDCKLWEKDGFDHSVDLYHTDERIAIEIEKSERKRVSDDVLKFIKGGRTQRDGRKKIEFGALVVPVNYRESGNLFQHTLTTLEFMRGLLFVEDIAVIGYRDPRWE